MGVIKGAWVHGKHYLQTSGAQADGRWGLGVSGPGLFEGDELTSSKYQ